MYVIYTVETPIPSSKYRLAGTATRGTHHGEAAILDLLDLVLWGVHARGVKGERVDEARLQVRVGKAHHLMTWSQDAY